MRSRAFAVALGLGALSLGALAATPCLALTVQAAPPRPDVAQHLHSTSTPAYRTLPGDDEVKNSFLATQRPMLGQGYAGPTSAGTTTFGFGPVRGAATVSPGYGAFWNDTRPRDDYAPLSLIPPRR
jgi:hypothetical protein